MSKVYEIKGYISDEIIAAAKDPYTLVASMIKNAAGEIYRQHTADPDPEVRGSVWGISTWHNQNQKLRVYTVVCGAEFDVAERLGKRKHRLTRIESTWVQQELAHHLKRLP